MADLPQSKQWRGGTPENAQFRLLAHTVTRLCDTSMWVRYDIHGGLDFILGQWDLLRKQGSDVIGTALKNTGSRTRLSLTWGVMA